jgi:hypothetical protein
MAYVDCPRCGLSAYTAARWSSIDCCARCGNPLPGRATNVMPIAAHPRFRPEPTRASAALLRDASPSVA